MKKIKISLTINSFADEGVKRRRWVPLFRDCLLSPCWACWALVRAGLGVRSEALAVTKLNPEYCQVVEFLDQRSAMLILNQSLLIKHPVTLNIQVCYLWHQRSIEIFRSHIFWLWYISFLGVPCSCCPTSHPSGRLSSLFKSGTRWSFLCLVWVQTTLKNF